VVTATFVQPHPHLDPTTLLPCLPCHPQPFWRHVLLPQLPCNLPAEARSATYATHRTHDSTCDGVPSGERPGLLGLG
jgi:hypothetical protein